MRRRSGRGGLAHTNRVGPKAFVSFWFWQNGNLGPSCCTPNFAQTTITASCSCVTFTDTTTQPPVCPPAFNHCPDFHFLPFASNTTRQSWKGECFMLPLNRHGTSRKSCLSLWVPHSTSCFHKLYPGQFIVHTCSPVVFSSPCTRPHAHANSKAQRGRLKYSPTQPDSLPHAFFMHALLRLPQFPLLLSRLYMADTTPPTLTPPPIPVPTLPPLPIMVTN